MILFDPTEDRETSKIHGVLSHLGRPMNGLERATGCDIAILPDNIQISEDSLSNAHCEEIGRALMSDVPRKEIAEQYGVPIVVIAKIFNFLHASQNGYLVQRKSGGDLLLSVPRLSGILEKMRVWTSIPWLLTTGVFQSTDTGKVEINGRESDFAYASLLGAIEAWQMRGGYYINLYDEKPLVFRNWFLRQQKKVNETEPRIIYFRRPPQQFIVSETREDAWMSTLMTFEGIGSILARNIGTYFGTLAASLCFLSDPTSPTWSDKPSGYGTVVSNKARARLGLNEKQRLQIMEDE